MSTPPVSEMQGVQVRRGRSGRRRTALVATWLTIAVLLGLGLYVPAALLAPVPAAVATVAAPDAATATATDVVFPDWGQGAVGLVDDPRVLAAFGEDTAAPIGSITKLVTALVVLEARPIAPGTAGAEIGFTAADVAILADEVAQGASVQPVTAGLVLSQREVLELVLIPSAGNYAESLAAWAFGSREGYLAAAADWLARHGLGSTTVVDASGIAPGNRSSPTELLQLGRLAMADPTVAEIVGMTTTTIEGVGTVRTTNRLLGLDGVDGLKTGTTDEAGACLLFTREVVIGERTVSLIGVLLGAPDRERLYPAVQRALDSTAGGFREEVLVEAGQVVGSFETEWGERADAVATERRTAVLWSADSYATVVALDGDVVTGDAGEDVGDVVVTVGEERIEVPVALAAALAEPDAWWRLTNPVR